MDFNTQDARKAAEVPRALHIKTPAGTPINSADGKPCLVYIIGASSKTVQNAIRDDARAKMKAADPVPVAGEPKPPEPDLTLEDYQAQAVAAASRLITGFENIDNGNRPAKAPDDVAWFLGLNMLQIATDPESKKLLRKSFAQQVLDAAGDDTAFLDALPA